MGSLSISNGVDAELRGCFAERTNHVTANIRRNHKNHRGSTYLHLGSTCTTERDEHTKQAADNARSLGQSEGVYSFRSLDTLFISIPKPLSH
jgi:hypothetical protein